ncbi:hypothetical protein FNV43_RR14725 [Rhamnella rubrinervis]|uniref:Uncharacterized protein n=1 Tax=Rhamnella rubrinervis TaxID=2594499 RepID=A0A8K0H3F9_9ROSA|nr:hypothetical protein FNV43_RR14725 [Rhamnella rubrinervis]
MLIPLQNSLWLDSQGEDQIWKGEKETLDDYASRLQYLKSLGGRYANRAASTVCIEGGLLLAAEYFKLSICVVGATTLSIGIYSIIWGKAKEEEEVRADFGSDSLGSASPIGNTTPFSVKWCLPQQGFIKVNVDAAFDEGQAAVAMVCAWRWVEWETDAKEVKAAVNSKEDPTCWYAYHSVCSIQKSFERQDWEVKWKSRNNNLAADAAAKLALSTNCVFTFDEFSLGLIPSSILDIITAEQAAALV